MRTIVMIVPKVSAVLKMATTASVSDMEERVGTGRDR
jgi:hypothetical protein